MSEHTRNILIIIYLVGALVDLCDSLINHYVRPLSFIAIVWYMLIWPLNLLVVIYRKITR